MVFQDILRWEGSGLFEQLNQPKCCGDEGTFLREKVAVLGIQIDNDCIPFNNIVTESMQ